MIREWIRFVHSSHGRAHDISRNDYNILLARQFIVELKAGCADLYPEMPTCTD